MGGKELLMLAGVEDEEYPISNFYLLLPEKPKQTSRAFGVAYFQCHEVVPLKYRDLKPKRRLGSAVHFI